MSRLKVLVATGCVAGVALVAAVAGGANAATVSLYNNTNYSGGVGIGPVTTWYNPNSEFNDAASSLKSTGTVTYYENIKYDGTHDTWTGNVSDLTKKPLRGENWNDRISSFQ